MKIIFADRNPELRAQAKVLTDWEVRDDLFEFEADAIVSPANSYGFMDGGLDWYISKHCGWDVQESLQNLIKNRDLRELLVGEALIVPCFQGKFGFVISAPTMRVPKRITDIHDVFLAARAATRKAMLHHCESVVFPGMGTGVGGVNPQIAIRMIKKGIDEALNPPAFPETWQDAQTKHYEG